MSVFFKVKETEFFYDVLLETLRQRKQSKVRRNDLIDMMMDAIKGELKDEEEHEEQFEMDAKLKHSAKKGEFDEMVIVSTALVLLVAGYDTTGSTLAYCCYQLSKNQEVQQKLRDEVDAIANDIDDEITYEQVQSMTYLDQVISETLRFYNPAAVLNRSAVRDYKIPNSDVVIEAGKDVWINSISVHMDPKHYETPEVFNPDHFSKEAKANRHP